jgi:hypothetical protein
VVIPLSGRVSGRASGPSLSRIDDGGGLQYVSWKLIGVFRFSRQGEYIGGGAASGSGQGGLTPGGAAALGCGQVLAPLCLCFGH